MGYQVLARKYRPQRFADVAGQDHVTRTLLNALSQDRIAHGYIFSGHRGIGKTTIARILAQALNCRNEVGSPQRPTPEPCGVCDSCAEVRQGGAVDVIEIDAATNRGIDEIRELRDAARYAPARDRFKIYILDEAHQITEAAFNALLKTLEEPPAHVIFMMATTEPENIPQTIRSRCQHFSFHAVRFEDILGQLRMIAAKEQVRAEDAALALLAEAGDGSMRDALSIMDQAIASAPTEDGQPVLAGLQIRELMGSVPNSVFERLMESVAAGQSAELMEQLNVLLNAGHSPSSLARQLVRYLRNTLMAKLGGEQTELLQISADERARAARTSLLFTEEDLTRNLQIILRTFDDLNFRQEQRFHLELGVLKLIHAQRLLPLEELLSGMVGGSVTRTGSAPSGSPSGSRNTPPPRPVSASAAPTASSVFSSAPSFSPFATAPALLDPLLSGKTGPQASLAAVPLPETKAAPRLESAPQPKAELQVEPRLQPRPEPPPAPRLEPHPEVRAELRSEPTRPVPASPEPASPDPVRPDPVRPDPVRPDPVSLNATSSAPVLTAAGFPAPVAATAVLHEPALAPAIPTPAAMPVFSGTAASVANPTTFPAATSAPAFDSPALSEQDQGQPAPPVLEPGRPVAAVAAPGSATIEALKSAVVSALANGGHSSAAQLLGAGLWTIDGSNLRIECGGIGKKMLTLTVNGAAEKIIRQEIQRLGGPPRFMVVPGEGPAAGTAVTAAPLAGSIQETALANPLVQRAREIFNAEVRSVVDLRTR